MNKCPQCPGFGTYLGTFGMYDRYRCRDCGWDFSAFRDDMDDVDPGQDEDEDEEPEWDGQPDEAQEWHDFDPDC